MPLLHLVCKICGERFASGVPLEPEHLNGVKLRSLEVCPACGAPGDYRNEDYHAPDEPTAVERAPLRDTPD